MMKFIRGRSATGTTSSIKKDNVEKILSNQEIHTANNIGYNSKSNVITINTNKGLIKINCSSLKNNRHLINILTKKNCDNLLPFREEASSLNSSCNDSVISCSNSAISSCTSCEERSVNDLELSCSLSDLEESTKFLNENDSQLDKNFEKNNTNQIELKTDSLITATQKLLLPKEFLENYECYSRQRSSQTVIKIYTRTLCSEIEYKTLSITKETTSKKVIGILLNKFKMKHRDPNLFYLAMEITIKNSGVPFKNFMVLNDESCPAQLKSCYPNDEIKFSLMMKYGGLVKVYDSCLMSGSLYKSILIAENTCVSELIQLMLHCYNSKDKIEDYTLYVVSKTGAYKLNSNELPLTIQSEWKNEEEFIFQLRRNKEVQVIKKCSVNKKANVVDTSGISCQEFQNYFYI